MLVRRKLNAILQTGRDVAHELVRAADATVANEIRDDQFRVSVERGPCPNIARVRMRLCDFGRYVLALRVTEAPNLITLNPLACQVTQGCVLMPRTGWTEFS